jgi:hypothetical protein
MLAYGVRRALSHVIAGLTLNYETVLVVTLYLLLIRKNGGGLSCFSFFYTQRNPVVTFAPRSLEQLMIVLVAGKIEEAFQEEARRLSIKVLVDDLNGG